MKKILTFTLSCTLILGLFAGCNVAATPDDTDVDVVPEIESVEPEVTEDMTAEEQAQAYVDAIVSSRDEEYNANYPILTPFNTDEISGYEMMLEILGLSDETAENYAVSLSLMNTQAYAIAVVKPTEGSEEAITASLQAFIDLMISNFDMYLIDQYEIAQQAELETLEDGTVILVISPDTAALKDAIVEAL